MIIPFKINNDINSTSKVTAEVQAMVLRQNNHMRIIYVPKIIDKSDDWMTSISGCFIAQRKGINDNWEDINGISLSNLKKGEWTKFDLSSEEWLDSLAYADKLREMCVKEKNFRKIQNKQVLILDEDINKDEIKKTIDALMNCKEQKEFISELMNNSDIINKILDNKEEVNLFLKNITDDNKVNIFNAINLNLLNPKKLIDNIDNSSEQFWQNLFKENPYYLSLIAPTILQIICGQSYMGAKAIDNSGSSIADFTYKQGIDNICIIEIKTPVTKLVENDRYRENVYAPSSELVSAVVQIKEQKDSFMKEYNSIRNKSIDNDIEFRAFDPKCYLIIGNSSDLNVTQMKSLNLFRNELKSVEIITFNELIDKVKLLYKILGGRND